MAIRIVRLGSARARDEGTRIGTVRHPPRGVPKEQHAAQNWYDVWLPELAPSAALVKDRAGRRHAAEVGRVREALSCRDGRAGEGAPSPPAGRDVVAVQLLGGLLLRGRGALSPLRAESTAERTRRQGRVGAR